MDEPISTGLDHGQLHWRSIRPLRCLRIGRPHHRGEVLKGIAFIEFDVASAQC